MLKQKHSLPISGATFIVLISFIYSLAGTILIPIFPVFVKNLFNNAAYAGYFMSFVYFLILGYILLSTYFLKNFDKYKILKFSISGSAITYLLLAFIDSAAELAILEIFRMLFVALNFVVIGLLIRDHSTKKTISTNEGFYFTIVNISFFIGPIIGGLLANAYSFRQVFFLASIFPAIVFLLILPKRDDKARFSGGEVKLFQNIKYFFRNKNIAINYVINLGLMSWLAVLYIYMPLYLNNEGINEKIIGYFLALVVVPLIILEIPVTKLAKSFSYKKLFFLGFLLIGLFGIAAFFFENIYIKMLFFVLTNLGVALIEPLKESYFFEVTRRADEEKCYPIFKTAGDVGYLISPLIFSTILLVTNFNIMFFIAAILMIGFGFLSLALKETKK